MALAFMSVPAVLLALSVRSSSLANQNFLHRSHSLLCVCVQATGDSQMDCTQTPSCCSDSSLLLFEYWLSFSTAWSHLRKHGPRSSNSCASCGGVKHASAMRVNVWIFADATDRDLESSFSKSISLRTPKMGNYAGEGQCQRNSGGGS